MKSRVLPGAEAFRYDAGPIGALLIHGFTGCPASMRPMGEWLAQHGVSTVGPRLAGHGTTWEDLEATSWQDWEREAEQGLTDLSGRCRDVIVVGLSMGGAMALHLAVKHADQLRGVAVVNALIRRPDLAFAPVARLFTKTVKGVGNDIKKPGQDEIVYDRVPLRAAAQMGKLLHTADAELPSLRAPLVVFSSTEDHTVKPVNSKRIYDRAGSAQKGFIALRNSYHVATLDFDAESIFKRVLGLAQSVPTNASEPA